MRDGTTMSTEYRSQRSPPGLYAATVTVADGLRIRDAIRTRQPTQRNPPPPAILEETPDMTHRHGKEGAEYVGAFETTR